jgi:hypothetical protein
MFSAKQAKTTKTGAESVSSSPSSLSKPSLQFAVPERKPNNTGMPDGVLQKMEDAFNTDFSNVKIHANSSKAPELDALAYTQGHNIHFAPGQFKPTTPGGQKIIGHELAHVVQQRKGIVSPTTKVKGLPVNDDSALEKEADAMAAKTR